MIHKREPFRQHPFQQHRARGAVLCLYTEETAGHTRLIMEDQKSGFLNLARYNARANTEMYEVVSALTGKALHRDTGSWFGSIHGILNHVLVAEFFWLNRFKPIFPESRVLSDPRLSPSNLSWQRPLHEDLEEMKNDQKFVDGQIIAWFEECPMDRYPGAFEYRDSAGNSRSAVAAAAFQYLFLHGIHHRGQISQILDTLGLPNNFADNGGFLEGPD